MALESHKRPLEPIEFGDEIYIPINIASLRLESVPNFSLYFRPGPEQPFVLYREQNTKFTAEVLERLQDNRVQVLYILQKNRGEYYRYIEQYLDEILADPDIGLKEKADVLYNSAQAVVEDVLDNPPSRDHIRRSKEVVRHTVDFMTADSFLLEDFLRSISCDYFLYTHSVNVVSYSIALAMQAGIGDRATLREIANGALLHDVGMSTVPDYLITKSGPLTQAEWDIMRRHPVEGHKVMSETGNLGEIALSIIRGHHEKLDGTGYPDRLKEDEISQFVRIVAIANVFDAMTTDRKYKERRNSFDALTVMREAMRRELDQGLVRLFVEMMGARKRW